MKKTLKGITAATLASAAFAGLLAGEAKASVLSGTSIGAASLVSPGMNASGSFNEDTHSCKGQNACKGKGGCHSGDNGCKGKNSCKGKGGCRSEATPPSH